MSLARATVRGAIRLYQLTFSAWLGRHCRYLPTCSAYADEAIGRHGVWAGGWMATARICRCRPGGGMGYDPPPRAIPAGVFWARPWRYGIWRTPVDATTGPLHTQFIND